MRIKIILPVSILALGVVSAAVYLRDKSGEPAPAPAPDTAAATDSSNVSTDALPAILHRTATASAQTAQASDSAPTQEDAANADTNSPEHQAYVAQTEAQLAQMGASHDPASFPTILNDLNNHDPQIRQSALAATMDFGNSNAIPTLRNEMNWTEDPEEKVAIEKAIKFLEMPTLTLNAYGQVVK